MKKALSLLLVLVLALSMSTMAFAATKVGKIDPSPNNQNFADGWWATTADLNGPGVVQDDDNKISIPFANPAEFVYDGATPGFEGTKSLTANWKKAYKNSNVGVKFRATKGSQVIDKIEVNDGGVTVKFKDPFKSNNPDGVDYAFKVYLTVGGKSWSEYAIDFEGNYKNETETDYGSDTDYFDFSYGVILKPAEFIRSFEGDLGEGVSVWMRALKNGKYWGRATIEPNDADVDMMIKYKDIDMVYHLDQVGIANVADHVVLNDADKSYYIYDGNGKYLGRGGDNLPFSETYYAARAQVEFDLDEDEPEDEEGEDEDWDYDDNSEGGGDDLYPENPHDNPGTGK